MHLLANITRRTIAALTLAATAATVTPADAQLILNEANAVGPEKFLETDLSKPYEGFDYGVIPHSGNNNSPMAQDNPGNPFPAVHNGEPGKTTFDVNPDWDGTTGFGRIEQNAGDWVELVVTEDHTDIRGWSLVWENEDPSNGRVNFSHDAIWSDLRAGTIITISEKQFFDEVRDGYPENFPYYDIHDTGHQYDLSTDTHWDPIGTGTPQAPGSDHDWHMHFHLPEDTTDQGNTDTQYFLAGSDIKVDNDDWQMHIADATGGMIQEAVGESLQGWATGGLGSEETMLLRADPGGDVAISDYEDVDWSTFGAPNMFNDATEDTLDGRQDFSEIRAWLDTIVAGDANLDGSVDTGDFLSWRQSFLSGEGEGWMDGDFDANETIDTGDFLAWRQNFLAPSAAVTSTVPEPATALILGLGGLGLIRRRRRDLA